MKNKTEKGKKKQIRSATQKKSVRESGSTEKSDTSKEKRFVTPEAEAHGWSCFGGH